MRIAKTFEAVNTSFPVKKAIKLKNSHIRVSALDTVIVKGGTVARYTCLRRSTERTQDRLKVGDNYFIVKATTQEDVLRFTKYCICIDDKQHRFIAVFGFKWLLAQYTDRILDVLMRVAVPTTALIFSIALIVSVTKGRSRPLQTTSETAETELGSYQLSTQSTATLGGETKTYVFGASVDDGDDANLTEEELLNLRIQEDESLADAEKNAVIPWSEQSASNESDTSESTNTGSSNNDTIDSDSDAKSDEELPVTSLKDTVITQPAGDIAGENEDPLFEALMPQIGAISISDVSTNYTITNRTGYNLAVEFILNAKSIATFDVKKAESKTVNLYESISETCSPTIVYTYYDEDNEPAYTFRSEIVVYVYD